MRAHAWLSATLLLSAPAAGGPILEERDRALSARGGSRHVFVVMLDGTRPDALRRAQAPALQGLAAAGVTYLQARTQYPSQTRVSFVTLPTGSYPDGHGIVGGDEYKDESWNTQSLGATGDPVPAQALVRRPTMFEELTAAGLTSLYAAMKGYELVGARGATWTINGKNTLDATAYATRYQAEVAGSADLALGYKLLLGRQLLDQTLEIVRRERPSLVVVNLGSGDYAAHSFGPDDPRYLRALEYGDALLGDLVKAVEALGIRDRSVFVISADHGFTQVDGRRVVAPKSDHDGHRLEVLAARGIEHFVTNAGGAAMGVYVRDRARLVEAASALRGETWCASLYCEDPKAGCDRSLRSLRAYFPGRSPDLMVDLDDDYALNYAQAGQHGSLRDEDMNIPLVLSGAGVAQGKVLGKASLVDVAPTVLRLLGLTPKLLRADGRVLEEALVAP
ncbi:MAG: alkaline phosphatase family protein [Acidobacteria bacterium]|nr:alkaline phosphatase family protein [Acidobacteriota bacterium]